MTYIRHRARMVEQAVVNDIRDTLIACRWLSGTTERKVVDPNDRGAGYQVLTVAPNEVLPLVGKLEGSTSLAELYIVDYFPEVNGEQPSRKTRRNTFAIDHGQAGESYLAEMGSNMEIQPYVFTMALYAQSDAVASSVMNDLKDRYMARAVRGDWIDLFDRVSAPVDEDSVPVSRLGVEAFRHQQSPDQATPWDVNLWYAELHLEDEVDPGQPT